LSNVFEKIAKLHAKNKFSFAIIAGDMFENPSESTAEGDAAVTSLLDGRISVPLPTYFTVSHHGLPDRVTERLEEASGELCPNLYFLGKRSTTKTSEGIRIVNLGGLLDPNVTAGLSQDKYLPFHTEGDAKSLHGANTADILITSTWPTSIRTGSKITLSEGNEDPSSEQCVADLCATLKPRYHFSTSPNFFYEREPFFHSPTPDSPEVRPITRFYSLACATSISKAKYLYAFSLDPSLPPPPTLPPGATASPLNPPKKRPLQDQTEAYSRFGNHSTHHRKRPRNQPPPTPSECFFCLSNPNLATHLITSIATDSYLTTAKGPLPTSKTFPSLGFPAHILIIPLTHAPTIASVPDTATYTEMQRYRTALHAMVAAKAGGSLGAVTWEVSRADGIHVHWQWMPVSAEMVRTGLVEAAFKVEAENEKYPLFYPKVIGDGAGEQGDYFRVWIWRPEEDGEGKTTELVLPLNATFRFDLQFGRRVMAKLLGLEKRRDWRDCGQEEGEEKADVEAFKKGFKEFDYSLEE
jgi:hypothetical protein